MAILQKELKLLWGRAANRCAICKDKLSEDKRSVSESFILGEQAHIVAEENYGPRGVSSLSIEERNSYPNLILLCPTCHTKIDKNVDDFPTERVHMLKSEHELWVERTLSTVFDSEETIHRTIYGDLIDKAVDYCELREWPLWTSSATSVLPAWHHNLPLKVFAFRTAVIRGIWPGTIPELERAIRTLSIVLNEASNTFLKHSEPHGDSQFADRFYHRATDPVVQQAQIQEFNEWCIDCHALVYEATKAANWFAEVVRKEINPMFFALEGKFVVTKQRGVMELTTMLFEYTEEEKALMPDAFCRARGITSY